MDWKSLLAPLFAKGLSWATRQAEGSDRGSRDLAKNGVFVDLASSVAAGAAATAIGNAASHGLLGKANDAIAKVVGVATTEDGLVNLVGTAVALHPTLNMDQQGALTAFLESRIVGTPGG